MSPKQCDARTSAQDGDKNWMRNDVRMTRERDDSVENEAAGAHCR